MLVAVRGPTIDLPTSYKQLIDDVFVQEVLKDDT